MEKMGNRYYQGPRSDHFDGKRFFNPDGAGPGNLMSLLKWKLFYPPQKWPKSFPTPFGEKKPEQRVKGERIRVTHVGHASLFIQFAGLNILIDPWWSERASPVSFAGPKRVNAPGIRFEQLPLIDFVLITHNHYDHLDIATLSRLVTEHNPVIIAPLGNETIISREIPEGKIITGDWGEVLPLTDSIKLHLEPCHHWSARGVSDRCMALWAAFVIENGNKKIYHMGDTGYFAGRNYREAAKKHGSFDLAILPIGAYEPRWFMQDQHQNGEEAVLGHLALQAKVSLGHHWGSLQLTTEAIEDPFHALEAAKKKHGVMPDEFLAMRPGQVWDSEKSV